MNIWTLWHTFSIFSLKINICGFTEMTLVTFFSQASNCLTRLLPLHVSQASEGLSGLRLHFSRSDPTALPFPLLSKGAIAVLRGKMGTENRAQRLTEGTTQASRAVHFIKKRSCANIFFYENQTSSWDLSLKDCSCGWVSFTRHRERNGTMEGNDLQMKCGKVTSRMMKCFRAWSRSIKFMAYELDSAF